MEMMGSKQLIMEEGGVELTLSPHPNDNTDPKKGSRKSSLLIQKIRNSPSFSVRKKNQSNNKQQSTTTSSFMAATKEDPEKTSSSSFDSKNIVIGDETYTFRESNDDEWGIAWSSSMTTAASNNTTHSTTTMEMKQQQQHQFQKQDFHKSTWLGALKKGSYSTYGVAALMTASSIIVHPILILAGVVWAVGAFRALDKE